MPTTQKQAEIISLRSRVEDRRTTVQTCVIDAKKLLELQPSKNCAETVGVEIRWRLRRAIDLTKAERSSIEAFLEDTVERIIAERTGKAPTVTPGVPNTASKSVQETVEKASADAAEKAVAEEASKIRPRYAWHEFWLWEYSPSDPIYIQATPHRMQAAVDHVTKLFAENGLAGDRVQDYQALESRLYAEVDKFRLPANEHGVCVFPDGRIPEVAALADSIVMLVAVWETRYPEPPKPKMTSVVRWDAKGVAYIVEFPADSEAPPQPEYRPKPKHFDEGDDL